MKLLFVHAHFDDYEFTAAGTFELWRRRDPEVRRRVLVCTDGAAGHHELSREATAARRWQEQLEAARLGGFEAELLRAPSGQAFREARLHSSAAFRPALWKAIRDFEPDYLFCPPVPADPATGVHVDHLDVAHAVREVAYLINVPHVYLPEYPEMTGPATPVRTPVILSVHDGYHPGGHGHDLAIDVTTVSEFAADLAWCHASQLQEWLPWVDRHQLSRSPDRETWRTQFRALQERRARSSGMAGGACYEFFRVTAWGALPTAEQLLRDFPGLMTEGGPWSALRERLQAWREAAGE